MTRRALLTALLVLGLAAPAHAGTAYISTSNGTFAIDTATGRRGEPVPFGGPMVVTPDNKTVYVLGPTVVRPLDTASNTFGADIPVPAAAGWIAITPDGGTVLVSGGHFNIVTPIATATNQPGPPISVSGPTDLAVAPDGRTAYALTAGHTVTPIDLATNTVRAPIALAHEPEAIEITPDGALAVVSESEGDDGFVQVIDLASGTPEPPVSLVEHQPAGDVAMAADGSTAYVVASPRSAGTTHFGPAKDAEVRPFTIATRIVGPRLGGDYVYATIKLAAGAAGDRLYGVQQCYWRTCNAGSVLDLRLSSPDRPAFLFNGFETNVNLSTMVLAPSPAASFTVAPALAGRVTRFDAAASNNDGGSLVKYAWDFGDRSTTTTNAASASHSYSNPGTYTVRLTTTNAGGCASRFVYTGQSALCNGSTTATTTRQVTIISPPATASTAGPVVIGRSTATVSGTVGDSLGRTGWRFEYGTTTGYGSTTPTLLGRGAVQATIGKLTPKTLYHYRLVVGTEGATPPASYGEDRTFTTATTGTLRLQAKTLRLRGKTVRVALRCASDVGCRGKLNLTSGKRTCATSTIRLKAKQRATKRLTIRSVCRTQRSARVTSTVTTGQQDVAATVRIKR